MAKQKVDLNSALNQAAGQRKPVERQQAQVVSSEKSRTPARRGKKMVGGHFDPAVAKELKLMAVEQDKSIQMLLEEAIGDLFEKHGRPRLV